jgi:hypothetical protein
VPRVAQRARVAQVGIGCGVVVQRGADLGHAAQGDEVKGLLLDGGDRVWHLGAVRVADRLVGVLPGLVLDPDR